MFEIFGKGKGKSKSKLMEENSKMMDTINELQEQLYYKGHEIEDLQHSLSRAELDTDSARYAELYYKSIERIDELSKNLEYVTLKHNSVVSDLNTLNYMYNELMEDHRRVKAGFVPQQQQAHRVEGFFTEKELKKLISMAHPDKNNGSEMAGEITKKLIKLRK